MGRGIGNLSDIHAMEKTKSAVKNSLQHQVEIRAKTYVLDTNVLLHDPQSIYKFQDNNLAIPVEVLEELDGIKGEQSTERGRNARRVHRILQELLPDSRSMHEGVELPNGGTLSIIINPYLMDGGRSSPAMDRLRAILPDLSKKDNRSSFSGKISGILNWFSNIPNEFTNCNWKT